MSVMIRPEIERVEIGEKSNVHRENSFYYKPLPLCGRSVLSLFFISQSVYAHGVHAVRSCRLARCRGDGVIIGDVVVVEIWGKTLVMGARQPRP
jgi:hypothetical protein